MRQITVIRCEKGPKFGKLCHFWFIKGQNLRFSELSCLWNDLYKSCIVFIYFCFLPQCFSSPLACLKVIFVVLCLVLCVRECAFWDEVYQQILIYLSSYVKGQVKSMCHVSRVCINLCSDTKLGVAVVTKKCSKKVKMTKIWICMPSIILEFWYYTVYVKLNVCLIIHSVLGQIIDKKTMAKLPCTNLFYLHVLSKNFPILVLFTRGSG